MKYAKDYFHEDFGNFLSLLAHFHLSLNRELLYQTSYKLPSLYLIGPVMTGKTSLTKMAKVTCPHKITSDGKLIVVEDSDKTLAVLIDSVTEQRESLIHDPVKWVKREDRNAHVLFEDQLYENKINVNKAKASQNANLTPLTGICYVFPGDFGYQIPNLCETLLTKSIWCKNTKRDLSSNQLMSMKQIYKDVTTQNGRFEGRFSCIFQDLLMQIDIPDFNDKVKFFYEELLVSHEGSRVNVSRFLENYAVLIASLAHLLETIGIENEVMDQLLSVLQKSIEEKYIPFTLAELSDITSEKVVRSQSNPESETGLDYICRHVQEQELKYIYLWLTFDHAGNIFIYQDFIKKLFPEDTKEKLEKSFGTVETKDIVKFARLSAVTEWFKESIIPGIAFGKWRRLNAFKKKLSECPEKFQSVILQKLNQKLVPETELTASSDIKKILDEFYCNEYCTEDDSKSKDVQTGTKMLKNFTPRKLKRTIEYLRGQANSSSVTGASPALVSDVDAQNGNAPKSAKKSLTFEVIY